MKGKILFGNTIVVLALLFGLLNISTAGPNYPERPVNMLVGLAAGGANDLTARALAEAVKQFFPKPITIVNKTGGAASIATTEAVQARPDGYTLIMAYSPALTILPHMNPNLPYKGPGDLQMICGVNVAPIVLADRTDSPWKTVQEMFDYARKNPGKIRLGHSGIGSVGHIFAEDLKQTTRLDITVVPFTGAAPATISLLGSHIELINTNPAPLMGHLRSGKVRNLAIYDQKRLSRFPEVPTFREIGLNVIDRSPSFYVAGPKGLPKEVIQTLYQAFNKAIKKENFLKFCHDNILVPDDKNPDDLQRHQESEYLFYGDLFKRIKVQ